MENLKKCETLTKLDARGIKKALMEFADFDIDARNEIFKMQRANFCTYRSNRPPKTLIIRPLLKEIFSVS